MYTIRKATIDGFWEGRKLVIDFNDDVNFLIGPNGTGKTTVINIIASVIRLDINQILHLPFISARLDISEQNRVGYIIVSKSTHDELPIISVKIRESKKDTKEFIINALEIDRFQRRMELPLRYYQSAYNEAKKYIDSIVRSSIISVNRASLLPSDARRESSNINTVLNQLRNDLKGYFSLIANQCSEETNKFQKFVFSSLLNVVNDESELVESIITDQGTEKKKLKDVFNLFSMLDKQLIEKIDSFYYGNAKANEVLLRDKKIDVNNFSYLINANRIHTIVNEWSSVAKRQNEIENRKNIFFEILSVLFQHKKLSVNETNEIVVATEDGRQFPIELLSSGEKQLLIILGNALLLKENETHIYIADEPELSLHIEWQEKLVSSIRRLSPNAQIIFATHSPDIVGSFQDKTILLNKIIYGK